MLAQFLSTQGVALRHGTRQLKIYRSIVRDTAGGITLLACYSLRQDFSMQKVEIFKSLIDIPGLPLRRIIVLI